MKSNLNPLVFAVVMLCCLSYTGMAQDNADTKQNADTVKNQSTKPARSLPVNNTITDAEFPENVNASVFEILQGRINGGTLSVFSEGLDTKVKTIARGGYNYNLQNYPVLVIDGLISPYTDNFLEFENIESISFIKGAAASALYGARGDGGIIRITTKQADENQPFRLRFHGSSAFGAMPEMVPVLSADDFRETVYDLHGEDSQAAYLLGSASTNWQEELFRQSFSHSHYLGATGTFLESQVPYRASVKFSDNQSNIITNSRTKTSAALDINPSFFDNTLQIHLKLNGFLNSGTAPSLHDDIRKEAIEFDPTQPVYSSANSSGSYFNYTDNQGNQIPNAPGNPVAVANLFGNTLNSEGLLTQLNTDYQLPFYESISVHANYSRSHTNREKEGVSLSSHSDLTNPGTERSLSISQYTAEIFDAYIT